MRDNTLFLHIDWFSFKEDQITQLREEVSDLDKNHLLNTLIDKLCADIVEKYCIDIPALNRKETKVTPHEAEIDVRGDFRYNVDDLTEPAYVPGTEIEVSVPFVGDSEAFTIQPTTYSLNPPRGTVRNGMLFLSITGINLEDDQVRQDIDNQLDRIDNYLTSLRSSMDMLNSELDSIARQCITKRRDKLIADQKLAESLGFKLKERPDSPKTYVAPEVRRKIRPKLPDPSTPQDKIEIILAEADYEHILGVIENMAKVMERSPSAFTTMNEESLRWHFLVQLNGHYEGQATGETFNYEGKTDILIRSEGRNIFIAECKYWDGSKKLTETINQILGYSSWRDTKVAVIIFNRNKGFTKVLEAMKSTTNEHANCKRELDQPSESSYRFIFSHRDDVDRELTLTVVAFDVPNE